MNGYPFARRKFCLFLSLALLTHSAIAIWPFPPKRFTGNALLNAGTMGLNEDGRVVAFGDFNGDQLSAAFTNNVLWKVVLMNRLKLGCITIRIRSADAVRVPLEPRCVSRSKYSLGIIINTTQRSSRLSSQLRLDWRSKCRMLFLATLRILGS